MADEGVEHCGQGDVARCEVTRTSTSSGVSLTEVISRPSGKGNKGDEGINLLEKRFLCCLEQIFGRSLRILRLLHQKVGRANYTRSLIGACPHCLQIEVRRGKIGTCSHVLTQWHNTPTHLREGEARSVNPVLSSLKRLIRICLGSLHTRFVHSTRPLNTSWLLGTMADLGRNTSELMAENALVRRKLIMLKQQVKRPACRKGDRLLLVLLQGWSGYGNKRTSPRFHGILNTFCATRMQQVNRVSHHYNARASRPRI